MQYTLIGSSVMPAVEFQLSAGEAVFTQSGGMCWMNDSMTMSTGARGGIAKGLGRMFAGESMFQVTYTSRDSSGMVAFASTVPGEIRGFDPAQTGPMICQKGAFLCAETSVQSRVVFTKRLRSALFGGEGFILQELSGHGMTFLEVDGSLVEKDLAPGQVLKVDTGNLVAFSNTVDYDIELVRGAMNLFLGGEGLFITKLTGPGKVLLQTQNFSALAGRIAACIPSQSS